ncbi:MAG: molybdenum cofactor biosynthesis protein MoaE [Gammaproteobacteria bacterium]|nr:molybdopterin-converting factor chain 2 [Gammaproteobacteria bacterium]
MSFAIRSTPIDPRALEERLRDARAGACVTFEGWVRNHQDGHEVTLLEYEAHEPIAVAEGEKIIAEAKQRFDVLEILAEHRVGRLEIGDCAVWVGVSAAHRGAAFDACRYVIDEIKHRVPIWKKEHYADGASGWVNCATGAPVRNAERAAETAS